jgi:colicin import membrane protein
MNVSQGLKCTIQVKLLSSGVVMDAIVISGSGDPVFDRSAENAVRKASPLPVPSDKNLFNAKFRPLTLVFDPDKK